MKMRFILAIFLFLNATDLVAMDLQSAVISKGRDTVRDAIQAAASPKITSVVKATGDDTGSGIAYTNLGTGSTWYRLYRNMKIYAVNTNTQTLIGSWSLTRWSREYIEKEFLDQYFEFQDEMFGIEYNDKYAPRSLGCLAMTPLRYGDIEGDGVNELILILGDTFLVFSPVKQKAIFSAELKLNDWFTEQERVPFYGPVAAGTQPRPQYNSRMTAVSIHGRDDNTFPAYRGYAKLYIGDFDKNGASDILVWRKLYRSLMQDDPNKGFTKIRDTFLHYSLVNGEYVQADTDQATIQTWLTDNALTWKKGYPDVSECAADAGKPIPEMSDPLLNDPDVLQ